MADAGDYEDPEDVVEDGHFNDKNHFHLLAWSFLR